MSPDQRQQAVGVHRASGLRQVYELVHQLRGTAGERQVPDNPKVGLAQVYGSPGTGAITILSR